MTPVEALAELEAALEGPRVVTLTLRAIVAFRDLLGSTFFAGFVLVRTMDTDTYQWVYAMRTGEAEALRDMARRAIVNQVTEKLTGTP